MSTLEALNAISEAIEAHKRQPELEATIKSLTDDRDFVKLERDEAERTIERLKARIIELEEYTDKQAHTIREQYQTITDLTDRNTSLDTSLTDVTRLYNDAQHTLANKEQIINILTTDKAALLIRLEDSKGVIARLTDTLKSIGASIVAAVEVPEVTPSAPFPVRESMALPAEAGISVDHTDSTVALESMAEPTDADLVGVAKDNSSSFNTPPKDETSPGTYAYRYW